VKRQLESAATDAQQADRGAHRPLRLSECGDTLTVAQLCVTVPLSIVIAVIVWLKQ
jgi:hypothetical protein